MRVNDDVERSFTSEARRAQIVSAAIVTISELGLGRASFAQIADRAGLSSTRMISYHFKGKDDLMEAVLHEVFQVAGEAIRPFVEEAASPTGQLRGFIVGSAHFFSTYRQHVIAVRDVFYNFRTADGTRRFGMELHEAEFAVISDIFRAGQAAGEFRQFDPRIMAMTLRHSLDGLSGLVATDPDLDVDTYTHELLAIFEGATRPLPPQSTGGER